MKNPEISVIMPAFNHEKFIGKAIESVLSQTFEDFELIIINDGSTDNTEAVIKQYNDSRIQYYYQENRGAWNAHNRGIEISKGTYISIINSDDEYYGERLEFLLDVAKKDNYSFIITDIELIDQHSNIIRDPDHWWIKWYKYLKSVYLQSDSPEKALLAGNFSISTSNFFFHPRIIRSIGLFRPFKYIIDYDFAFRAAKHEPGMFKFLYDKKLLSYRLHGDNTILKNPLLSNLETLSFLSEAILDIYGKDISIPTDHLNTIKNYLTKELAKRYKKETNNLKIDFDLEYQELDLIYKHLDLKYRDLKSRQLSNILDHNKKMLEEIYILKNSYSFRIGRMITAPLRILATKVPQRNTSNPIKTTVTGTNELHIKLDEIIGGIELVSFDIFDTIFERDIDPPDKVKEIAARYLSEKLLDAYKISCSPNELLKLRDDAELELRHKALSLGRDFECRYSDIVKEMVTKILGKYDAELATTIMRQELDIEDKVLYVKKGMIEILEWLKNKGKRIIAISDMYLDREHIQEIFRKKSLHHFIEDIYVSSELSMCKYSGNLFKHVLMEEQVLPAQMLHIGDNISSDHRMPSKFGINTIYLKDKAHLRKKYILKTYNKLASDNPYWRGRHFLQLIRPALEKNTFFYNFGFSFLGPVYSTFIYGLIEDIKRNNLKTLYFIAREGELFLRIFQLFAPHFLKENQIPFTKYIYLSRKSTALASLYKGLSHEKAILPLYNPKQQGLYSLCNVFSMPHHEFAEKAREYGFPDIKTPIHNINDERFKLFLNDKWVQETVFKYAQKDKGLLEEYLTQIGFFSNSRVALVDIGWNATIQKFLQDAFIERADYPYVYGFYLGFRNGMMHRFDETKNTIIGVLYDERLNNPAEKIMNRFEEIFEEGARALHPTTIGYKKNIETGVLEPIFKDDLATDRITEISFNGKIEELHRGVLDFSEEFIRAADLTGYNFQDIKPFILTMIERLVAFPNAEEANNLMNLKHAEDFGYENVMDFNNDKINSIGTILKPNQFIKKIRQSNWAYGTAQSSRIPGITLALRLYDLLWGYQKQ